MDVSGYLTRLVRRAGGGAGPEGGRPLTPPRPATTEVAGDPFETVEGPPNAEQVEAPARPHPRSEGPRSVQPQPTTHRAEPPVHTVDPDPGKRPVQVPEVPRAAESPPRSVRAPATASEPRPSERSGPAPEAPSAEGLERAVRHARAVLRDAGAAARDARDAAEDARRALRARPAPDDTVQRTRAERPSVRPVAPDPPVRPLRRNTGDASADVPTRAARVRPDAPESRTSPLLPSRPVASLATPEPVGRRLRPMERTSDPAGPVRPLKPRPQPETATPVRAASAPPTVTLGTIRVEVVTPTPAPRPERPRPRPAPRATPPSRPEPSPLRFGLGQM